MKNHSVFLVLLPVLVLALAGMAQAWQGRMGGMQDPYGLVQDESDFLIHPAKIADGQGVQFYGDYSFTYTWVPTWDYKSDEFISGVWTSGMREYASGDELGQDGMVGAAFPLGTGRMGLFFNYEGVRGDYDGNYADTSPFYETFKMWNALDDFSLRLLYGLPIGGGFKLGAETDIAYHEERQVLNDSSATEAWLMDNTWPGNGNLYMWPYQCSYWQTVLKGSLDGTVGPLDVELTIRGGFDFAGKNELDFEDQFPIGHPDYGWDLKGDVKGWLLGGDLWLRYPLGNGYTLTPLLVRVDYQQRTLYEMGAEWPANGDSYDDKDEVNNLTITAGGGVEKELNKDTRIAAGIYYVHLSEREDYSIGDFLNGQWQETGDFIYPESTENQILVRLAGEHTISPAVALRAGLSFFYGWVDPMLEMIVSEPGIPSPLVLEGSGSGCPHWGIGASLGGTVKVKPLTLEPYISGGYQQLRLNWNYVPNGVDVYEWGLTQNEWSMGGGLSILFNL
jgi:hypothetical protein